MSWGERFADEHHTHREVDDLRYDAERALEDARRDLDSRITSIRDDNAGAREELWTELHNLSVEIQRLREGLASAHREITTLKGAADG
jgi:chromosome segregation ATPase